LAGKHSTHRTSRLPRLVMPVVVSLTVVAVAGGTAALTLTARASGTHQGASASASASANATDLELARADLAQRASRGEARPLPSPTPSKSKSPSPSPTPSHSASPADTGTSGECEASYYDTGTTTADGEAFDPNALTAANKTLPFNTMLKVTNTANGESVNVRINDRGPYVSGRCLDLTTAAFKAIASLGSGTIDVKYQVVG
jgi:peptidoglycan lytic transglycosylase